MNIYVTLLGFICILIFIFLIKKYYYIEKYTALPEADGRIIGCKTTHGGGQHTHGDCGIHNCNRGQKYQVNPDGVGSCSPCPDGQSSGGGQDQTCQDCPIGTYESYGLCTPCRGREYQNEPKKTFCKTCDAGRYLYQNKSCTTNVVSGWQNDNFKLTCLFGDDVLSGVGSTDNKLICSSGDSYVWDYDGSYPGTNKSHFTSAYSTIRRAGETKGCWEWKDGYIKNQESCDGGREGNSADDNNKRFTILCDEKSYWSGGYNECVIRSLNTTDSCLKNNSGYLKPNGSISGNDCQRLALIWGGADKSKSSPIRCCH